MLAFVVSTICALAINVPGRVTASEISSLRNLVNKDWDDVGWDKQVASLLVDYLESLRNNNERNAVWLIASIAFQIAGIALTAITAILILANLH